MIKNILVIDSNEMFISKINGFFWEAGIKNILTASTVKEALLMIRKNKPDLILVDMLSPDISGFDAIRIFSQFDNTIRIIVTTDFYNQDYCNMAFEAGADAFVNKDNFREDISTIINAVPKNIQFMFEKYLLSKN